MGEGKKIIDLRHGRGDETPQVHDAEPDMAAPAVQPRGQDAASDDSEAPWLADEDLPDSPDRASGWTIGAASLAAVWTGFFVWASLPAWQVGISPAAAADSLTQWAIPVIAILALHLVMQRNSTAEARRFSRVAGSLRAESAALESRLSHINSELSLAREFLANQSLELESLGRVSSDRLRGFAEELRTMIEASDTGMRAIGEVSEAASGNMDKLRNHLPVIANSAKDVTNQIGNAGRTAQSQVESMIAAFEKLNTFGQAASTQIATLVEDSDTAADRLAESVARSGETLAHSVAQATQEMDRSIETVASRLANTRQNLDSAAEAQSGALHETLSQLRDSVDAMAAEMAERAAVTRSDIRAAADDLGLTLGALAASTGESEAVVRAMVASADAQISDAERRLQAMDKDSTDALARLAFALSALDGNVAALNARLASGSGHADVFDAKSTRLRDLLATIQEQVGQAIPAALSSLDQTTAASQDRVGALHEAVSDVDGQMVRLGSILGNFEERIAGQTREVSTLADSSEAGWRERAEDIGALIGAMRTAREEIDQINGTSAVRLVETMRDVQREAHAAADEARRAMDRAITGATQKLGQDSGAALEKVLRGKAEELVGKLESAISRAVGATSDASLHLKDQLSRVDDLASHLERRVADARELAEERTDNDFARRLALLTESLNSAAIDVDKILSTEVSDTAWSAYLRGDRGVFTRRAVRLIDNGEAKDIAQAYENDPEFFELVNRYIHDFEAMLRTVLSTRDGGVMGVTLLSSETGKLYVALAQAIERLRD
jgi:gas vesicle protein